MSDLVSILIPAYNAEKWIGETIRSALEQTWPKKEIIIVDDGSSDNTLVIAKQFESRSLKVISQENRGASVARNKALEYAQGDYIQWLDADDLLAPDKIAEQMKNAECGRTSLTLLSSSYAVFYWRLEKARFVPHGLWQDLSPIDWFLKHFNNGLWLMNAAWLVSRRVTEKAGRWDERLTLNDDGEYFCRTVAASKGIRFVKTAKCYYRQSGFNQLSKSTSDKACKSFLLSLALSIGHLRALEESERTRSASLVLLQDSLQHFYPDKTEMLGELNGLASDLGGALMTPRLGWKSDLMRRLLGWRKGLKVMAKLREMKFFTTVRWDEWLYRMKRLG